MLLGNRFSLKKLPIKIFFDFFANSTFNDSQFSVFHRASIVHKITIENCESLVLLSLTFIFNQQNMNIELNPIGFFFKYFYLRQRNILWAAILFNHVESIARPRYRRVTYIQQYSF